MPINTATGPPWTELSGDRCPHCSAPLIGDLIPETERRPNSPDRYRREIGIETDDYDGILYWSCPDCHGAWAGWLGPGSRAVLSRRRAAEHNRRVAENRDQESRVRSAAATQASRIGQVLACAGLTPPRAWRCTAGAEVLATLYVDDTEQNDAAARRSLADLRSQISDLLGCPTTIWVGPVTGLRALSQSILPDPEPWPDSPST